MNDRKCVKKILAILVFSFALSGIAQAGIPEVSHFMVTDVTTRSFSVIWMSSEASTATLEVFEDADGLLGVSGADIIAQPVVSHDTAIQEAAENNGVMKVQITGLEPDTIYYFQTATTSKSTSDTVLYPEVAPLMQVTTEHLTVRTADSGGNLVPFSNDVIIEACFLADRVTPATGTLLLATIEGANYPLTAFVGDGVDLPYALIDLNNAFGLASHENIDLEQGENLTLLNFRGIEGNSIVTFDVPLDNSLTEVKQPEYSLKPGWNMVSLQLDPSDPATASVLNPILDKVSSIWAYDALSENWIFYDKNGLPLLNDLNELHSNVGYWIKMDEAASFPIRNGSLFENGVQLTAGWNLVGFNSISTVPLAEAISSISGSLNSIWTFDVDTSSWIFYNQNGIPFLNTLSVIKPGVSYWVNVSENVIWY